MGGMSTNMDYDELCILSPPPIAFCRLGLPSSCEKHQTPSAVLVFLRHPLLSDPHTSGLNLKHQLENGPREV
jgi:hypothetical protein